jgi:lysophospholipase L1-like esterase
MDAQQQSASCTFSVTVTRPGLLSATRFLAFGDSMTEGSLTPCPLRPDFRDSSFLLNDIRLIRAAVNVPTSYPAVLGGLLAGRYLTQSTAVTNVGLSGERVSDATFGTNAATLARLRSEMAAFSPHVVFLLEGVNDLNSNLLHPEITIPAVVQGLRDLAREARQRGALQVFIATLPPQEAGACRGYSAAQIPGANNQIRAMVTADQHVLVDIYAAFGGVPGPYIGVDGLHPNEMGYQKIAQAFLDTIRGRLEIPR